MFFDWHAFKIILDTPLIHVHPPSRIADIIISRNFKLKTRRAITGSWECWDPLVYLTYMLHDKNKIGQIFCFIYTNVHCTSKKILDIL